MHGEVCHHPIDLGARGHRHQGARPDPAFHQPRRATADQIDQLGVGDLAVVLDQRDGGGLVQGDGLVQGATSSSCFDKTSGLLIVFHGDFLDASIGNDRANTNLNGRAPPSSSRGGQRPGGQRPGGQRRTARPRGSNAGGSRYAGLLVILQFEW